MQEFGVLVVDVEYVVGVFGGGVGEQDEWFVFDVIVGIWDCVVVGVEVWVVQVCVDVFEEMVVDGVFEYFGFVVYFVLVVVEFLYQLGFDQLVLVDYGQSVYGVGFGQLYGIVGYV